MTFQFTDSFPPANWPPAHERPSHAPEPLRLIAVGSPENILITIQSLHRLGYAEPNDWSRLMPTGRPGEMMAILTKRMIQEGDEF